MTLPSPRSTIKKVPISVRIVVVAAMLAGLATAQQQTTSSKTRPNDTANAQGPELGEKPEAVLKIEKLSGVIRKIDLQARSVTIDLEGKEESLELTFAQPAGREQIKTSKKAMKTLGKKKLSLEEVKVGAKVELRYYTSLDQMMELIVDEQT